MGCYWEQNLHVCIWSLWTERHPNRTATHSFKACGSSEMDAEVPAGRLSLVWWVAEDELNWSSEENPFSVSSDETITDFVEDMHGRGRMTCIDLLSCLLLKLWQLAYCSVTIQAAIRNRHPSSSSGISVPLPQSCSESPETSHFWTWSTNCWCQDVHQQEWVLVIQWHRMTPAPRAVLPSVRCLKAVTVSCHK